ncbi:unnamed protein product [Durusdinium trenchii]|uniref:Uncharacterized protein n=1 Tax=Durusdinium trenchii TaxID=1381693 RepID=A0ABP0SH83_9DINO
MIWQGLRLVASSLLGPVLDLVLVDVAALGVVLELVAALGVVFAWGVAAVAWPMLSGQELGKFLQDLTKAVEKVLSENLVIMDAEPPGLQAIQSNRSASGKATSWVGPWFRTWI